MLDFHHQTEEASTVNKKTRDIVIDNLSRNELLIESNYGDSSRNQSMRFGADSLRESVAAKEVIPVPKKIKISKAQKAEQDFFNPDDGSQ